MIAKKLAALQCKGSHSSFWCRRIFLCRQLMPSLIWQKGMRTAAENCIYSKCNAKQRPSTSLPLTLRSWYRREQSTSPLVPSTPLQYLRPLDLSSQPSREGYSCRNPHLAEGRTEARRLKGCPSFGLLSLRNRSEDNFSHLLGMARVANGTSTRKTQLYSPKQIG